MKAAYHLPLLLLGLCVACPAVSTAQATTPGFNPGAVWFNRLEPLGPALYLPARQRGLQQASTYLLYQGQRYLMQALYYDAQGRLESQEEYRLTVVGGRLAHQLARRITYHTQVAGDSLVSTAEETGSSKTAVNTWRIWGNIPPTQPLLGTGPQAYQLVQTTSGQVRAKLASTSHTYSWVWSATGTFQGGPIPPLFHGPYQTGISGAVNNYETRQFTARAGQAGVNLTWQRRYRGRGQHFREECRLSYVSGPGGAATECILYTRTASWRKGWCRTEHFTAMDQVVDGQHPAFDVQHQYIFYPKH